MVPLTRSFETQHHLTIQPAWGNPPCHSPCKKQFTLNTAVARSETTQSRDMASTTPGSMPSSHERSTSRNRIPSRPTTPLRPLSRTSLRASTTTPRGLSTSTATLDLPLEQLEPAFAEFSDSMADLEANMMHLQLLHESIARFNENFASFLYGLNMSAFCVDFPEAPSAESFRRAREQQSSG